MSPTATKGEKVQGIDSSLGDLTLHGGQKLDLDIGEAVQSGATLTRTISGASSLHLPLHDPEMKFLDSALARERWTANLDGLHFRWLAADVAPPLVTLTLEDRSVAKLREWEGPVKALREGTGKKGDITRAEFIVARVKEILPRAPITCPQLHVKQPIKTEKQSRQAASDASTERGHGIGDVKSLTVKGGKASASQKDMAERVLLIAEHDSAPASAMVALIAACIVESELQNLSGGDADSAGVLQVRASVHDIDPRDVEACVNAFLHEGFTGQGGAIQHAKEGIDPATSAQLCQGSGPAEYGKWVKEARGWVEAYLGGEATDTSITVQEPYVFEIKKTEDYWAGIQRLAKEVNWRAFFVGERFFYIAETDLFRSKVRLAIKRNQGDRTPDTPGVEGVTFSFNANRPATEVTVTADAKKWGAPPGSVVTLEGYGPASIGSGDPPVKANKKGQRQGIDSAVIASTHEGKGRYLVESIEAPLRDSDVSDLKRIAAKLRKPTAPLPEPAATTKTISGVSSDAAGDPKVEAVLSAAERIADKHLPYVWGGFSESGYDCSGFVSKLLNVGGWLSGRLDTTGLAGWGESGAGEFVTVYVHTGTGSATTEHTIIEIAGKFFQSGGGENSHGSATEEFSPSPSYLATFNVKRHPKGY